MNPIGVDGGKGALELEDAGGSLVAVTLPGCMLCR